MKFDPSMPGHVILEELGRRVRHQRIALELTQAKLAAASGVPLRTIERLEAGHSVGLEKCLLVLRALRLTWNLDQLLPETQVRPMHQLGTRHMKERQRASTRRSSYPDKGGWTWGDKK